MATQHGHHHHHHHPGPDDAGPQDPLDPANQSLADALRKSFRVLKLLMLVLVGLYLMSGWFSVRPNEVGVVIRYGRIVGADTPGEQAVLGPGWNWSWPYPFESWTTVESSEREIPVEFMFQRTAQEEAAGVTGYKLGNLSPERDDYLITGDVNILHAKLLLKYRITDAVAYLRNVHPMPEPGATVRSADYKRYPEYGVLKNIVRNATIETAARFDALAIRGKEQDVFLLEVTQAVRDKLEQLAAHGQPLGISVDPNNGVIAPKSGREEAIQPPKQTLQVFDQVVAAESEKSATITRARSAAQERLLQAAGPRYGALADAIADEMALIREAEASPERRSEMEERLSEARRQSETLLTEASGVVRQIIKAAEIRRNAIVKEAAGDFDRFMAIRPEYERNPRVFRARLLDDMYARALENPDVTKVYVPPDAMEYRLLIPRSSKVLTPQEKRKMRSGERDRERRLELLSGQLDVEPARQ